MPTWDEERKRLGVTSGTGTNFSPGQQDVDKKAGITSWDEERIRLGALPDIRPSTQLRQNLPSPFETGFGGLQNTTLGQAAAGNPSALQTYKNATGFDLSKPSAATLQSQRDAAADDRARNFFGNAFTDNVLIPVNNFIDNSILGKAATRTSLSAANALNLYPDDNRAKAENRPSTGSRVADTALDIGGALAGYTSNPAGVGVAGQGLLSGSYGVANKLVGTGTKFDNWAVNAAAKGWENPSTQRLLSTTMTNAYRGAIAGGISGANSSLIRGESSGEDVGYSVAAGVGFGGFGDAIFGGLAQTAIKKLFQSNKLPLKEAEEILGLPLASKQSLARAGQATRLPDGDGVITNPYTFKLGEATPSTAAATSRYNSNVNKLSQLDNELSTAEAKQAQSIINEYKSLKQIRDSKGLKPAWYKQLNDGKRPTNRQLFELAGSRVVPDENLNTAYTNLQRRNLQNQVDQFGNVTTDAPTRVTRLSTNTASAAEPVPTAAAATKRVSAATDQVNPAAVKADDYVPPAASVQERVPQAQTPPMKASTMVKNTANSMSNSNVPRNIDEVTPTGEQIIQPQANLNGIGIQPFRRINKYENLSTTTKSQLVSRQKREPRQLGKLGQRLYTNLVDDLNPVNNFTKYANEVLNETITADKDPYRQALTSRGSDMIAKQITTDAFVDQNGNVVGQSLKDAIKEVPYKDYVSFEDYLLNKHAITRHDRGEKVFADKVQWTPEKGAQIIADYERMFPMFKEASDNVYQYNQNLVQHWLVDTGMISQKQADAYFAANPYYVPNKRYFTSLEKGGRGFSKSKDSFGNQSNPVKKLAKGGSQRQIISPIESIIENTDAFVKAANRNKVMQNFVDVIEQDADDFKDFAEIVDDTKAARKLDIQKELTNPESEDAVADLIQEATTDFQKFEQSSTLKRTKLDKDNIVRAMINGEPTYVKFNDPDLLNAMLAIGPESSGFALRILGHATKLLKTLATGINPLFNFAVNIFRDIPQSYIQSKTVNNPLKFIGDMFVSIVDVINESDVYKLYKSVGGGHSSSVADNRNMLARSKSQVLPQTKLNIPARGFRKFEDWLNVVESVPRLAEFKRSQKLGNTVKQALFDANEITVNFKRRGALSRELDKIFPYWNAAWQGLDKTARTFKDNPIQATVKTLMAITIPTMVMYSLNNDDPLYQKLSKRAKDNFIMIPRFILKNGSFERDTENPFYKIAKPQELGTVFSDIPERLMRKMNEDDPEAFKDFSEQLRTTFLPPGISGFFREGDLTDKLFTGVIGDSIIGPIANLKANKDFADRPIVPGYLENLSPELQSDANTSSLSKWIGEQTNSSPKKIDYLIKQYTGFIGQVGLPAMSPANSGNNAWDSIQNAFTKKITADPVYQNDFTTDFYNYKEQLDQANTDKDLKELPAWYNDNVRKQLDRWSKDMSEVRKEIRTIQANTSITADDKRKQLRDLQIKINEIAEKGNNYARENNIPNK